MQAKPRNQPRPSGRQVAIHATPEDRELLAAVARAQGLSHSALMRTLVRREARALGIRAGAPRVAANPPLAPGWVDQAADAPEGHR